MLCSVAGEVAVRIVRVALGSRSLPRRKVSGTFRACRDRRHRLAFFRSPQVLHEHIFPQAFQAAIKMVPCVAKRLLELLADFAQV